MINKYLFFFLLLTTFCVSKNHQNSRINLEFIKAAKYEEPDHYLQDLMKKGADINFQDSCGNTALHYSLSQYNRGSIVNTLLFRKKIKVNLRNQYNQTPILLTLDNELIKKLINLGAKVNVQDYLGKSPLHYACSKNDLELVSLLLSRGAKVNLKDNLGNTPLISCFTEVSRQSINGPKRFNFCATPSGLKREPRITSYKIVNELLNKGAKINESDKEGKTALYYAIREGNTPIVILLLSSGAKISNDTSELKELLIFSIYNGNSEIVKWLLEQGCDPNQIRDEKTILYTAAEVGVEKTLRYLLEAGGNPSISSNLCYGCQNVKQLAFPIHAAANSGNIETMRILINKGININSLDYKQQSPLHVTIRGYTYNFDKNHLNKNPECIEFLLKNGANPNQINQDGQTPLMLLMPDFRNQRRLHGARKYNKSDLINIIDMFASKGANFNIRDTNETSVFTYISSYHNIEITERMLSAGANINSKDNSDNTALDYALISERDMLRLKEETTKSINEGNGGLVWKSMEPKEKELELYINYLIKNGAKKGKDISNH